MICEIPSHEASWLELFFSGENQLNWKDILSRNAPPDWLEMVYPWLNYISENPDNYTVVLPRFRSSGPYEWYGIAPTQRLKAQLSEDVKSFLIPSFAEVCSPPDEFEDSNYIEVVLFKKIGLFVLKYSPLSENYIPQITQQLSLYRSILTRRPPIPDRTQRPFGQVRAEFDRALLLGEENTAEALLQELILSGRLNAEQQKCLEIRLLSGLDQWETLGHNYALISSIMDLSLPTQTLVDLTVALYQTHIIEFEKQDPSIVAQKFRDHVAKKFGPLFRERKGIRHPIALRAFLLFELSQPNPDVGRCNSILNTYPENAEGKELTYLWASTIEENPQGEASILDRIRNAILDEDYEIAFNLCINNLDKSWSYQYLLRCGVEIGTKEIAKTVLGLIPDDVSDILQHFNHKDKNRLEILRRQVETDLEVRALSDWKSWVAWVNGGNFEKDPLDVLRECLPKWRLDDYVGNFEKCSNLAEIIGNTTGNGEIVLRGALPHLIEFFTGPANQSRREFTPLYSVLIQILGWSDNCSTLELELASALSEALLKTGTNQALYNDLIDNLLEILSHNDSFINLDWALSIAEILAIYNCQSDDRRLQFFMGVFGIVKRYAHRITLVHRSILQLLARDYGCIELLDSIPKTDAEKTSSDLATARFSGLIGIYTLTFAVAQRAKQSLEQLLPLARIELNEDHVKTPRLIQLAKTSDIFVFTYRSSKHAAYYGVKDVRESKDILTPSGGGSASLVTLIMEEVRKLKSS